MLRTKLIILLSILIVACCAQSGWAYPPEGYDVMPCSSTVKLFNPVDPNILEEVVEMVGYAVVWRSDPYDTGDGTMRVNTLMDTLLMRGVSTVLFSDSIFITLDRTILSEGAIIQLTPGIDFPALSYFDIHYQLVTGTEPSTPKSGRIDVGFKAAYEHGFEFDLIRPAGRFEFGVQPLNLPTSELKADQSTQEATEADKNPSPAGVSAAIAGGGGIYGGVPFAIEVHMNNYTAENIKGVANGFRIYSPEGATWTIPVVTPDPAFCSLFDLICTPVLHVVTGSNDDTVGIGASVIVLSGLTPGWDGVALTIASQVDVGEIGKSLCIDSAYFPPSGTWKWASATTSYFPAWGGPYCWDITEPPCQVDCPAGGIAENEPCGDDLNGGCNMQPPAVEPIQCGETICGTAWADQGVRDTDWYEFTINERSDITLTASAEFPFVVGFIDTADCALAGFVSPGALGDSCETVQVTRRAGPGTYWVFMGAAVFYDYPCGVSNDYWFLLQCVPLEDTTTVVDTIGQIPPLGRNYDDPRLTPIRDPFSFDTVAFIVHNHRPDPPPGDVDTVPTWGSMDVIIGPVPPAPDQEPDEVIILGGEVIVSWGDPYTNPQGLPEFYTQLAAMNLTGTSLLWGPAILSLDGGAGPSEGLVTGVAPGEYFPAESFFDVYYQVEFPQLGQTIIPEAGPPHMVAEGGIDAMPPFNAKYSDPNWHAVVDRVNPSLVIGWVRPIHWVAPPQTPGACCDTATGECRVTIPALCTGPNDAYQGDNTTCSPNPCVCTGWTPGVDTILFSSFLVDFYHPTDSVNPLGVLTANGVEMIVQRGAPYEDSPGIWMMDTDILAFSGGGNSPLVGGPFTLILDPTLVSSGWIRMCEDCNDNWAESFFDINYKIQTPMGYPNAALSGNAQMELPCSTQWDPGSSGGGTFNPPNGNAYVDPRKVPIYDENGEIYGYTWKHHRVDDEPLGACCNTVDRSCRIATQAECSGPNDVYQGDETVCDPNPCICTDWQGGTDIIHYTAFEITIQDPFNPVPVPPTTTAYGVDMEVMRYNLHEDPPGSDIWVLDVKVISLTGSGNEDLLGGDYDIVLDPNTPSTGEIRMCEACNDHWAESNIEVNYLINTTFDPPRNVLSSQAQMVQGCEDNYDPYPPDKQGGFSPPWGLFLEDTREVAVYDVNGDTVVLVSLRHWVDDQPLGACCDTVEHTCRQISAARCIGPQDQYLGDYSPCWPNPCVCTGWTPGIDTIGFSSFSINMYHPTDTVNTIGEIHAYGVQMIVQRGAPYESAPGIWMMDTDILEFSGSGNSPLAGGPFTLVLDPTLPSSGWIRMCEDCNDNWAESFFDINYEIQTPMGYPNAALRGNAQMELPCSTQWDPGSGGGGVFNPPNGNAYNDPRKVPIYDENGEIYGYTWKHHRVDDEPLGACCDVVEKTCRIVSQADCSGPNDVYQGDNTGCTPNPCICTDWTPGIDTINYSTFAIDMYDASGNPLGTVHAFGLNMIVQRLTPYEEAPDRWRMNTQIIEFGGDGNDPLLGGPFTISLNPDSVSGGYIRHCEDCSDNLAESHWDIHYQLNNSLGFPSNIYKGLAEMDLNCDVGWDPGTTFQPPNNETYNDPRKVPIIDANGDTVGYTIKRHSVHDEEPSGACCFGTSCSFITLQACVEQGGVYVGDSVPCDPNPCEGCPTGWEAGVDTIYVHDFNIELYDETGTVLQTTLQATGQVMVVERSEPYETTPGFYRMTTTILQFGGSGHDPVVLGDFEIQLDPNRPSGGYIQMCNRCNDSLAESFFEVPYVITTGLAFPMDQLSGSPAAMHLSCSNGWNPLTGFGFTPPADVPYDDPRIVPLYDANGQVIGQTRKRHTPRGCCCGAMRGNIDCDPACVIDISDLVYLVDWMFTGGPEPCCFEEVDVNCDGVADISDLVWLVDYMFTGGPPPCPCDCTEPNCPSAKSSKIGMETMRRWSAHAVSRTLPASCRTGAAR